MANPSDVRWFEFGRFRLDARALVLFRGSRVVPLPVRAVETLVGLVRRPGEVLLKGDAKSTPGDTVRLVAFHC